MSGLRRKKKSTTLKTTESTEVLALQKKKYQDLAQNEEQQVIEVERIKRVQLVDKFPKVLALH